MNLGRIQGRPLAGSRAVADQDGSILDDRSRDAVAPSDHRRVERDDVEGLSGRTHPHGSVAQVELASVTRADQDRTVGDLTAVVHERAMRVRAAILEHHPPVGVVQDRVPNAVDRDTERAPLLALDDGDDRGEARESFEYRRRILGGADDGELVGRVDPAARLPGELSVELVYSPGPAKPSRKVMPSILNCLAMMGNQAMR